MEPTVLTLESNTQFSFRRNELIIKINSWAQRMIIINYLMWTVSYFAGKYCRTNQGLMHLSSSHTRRYDAQETHYLGAMNKLITSWREVRGNTTVWNGIRSFPVQFWLPQRHADSRYRRVAYLAFCISYHNARKCYLNRYSGVTPTWKVSYEYKLTTAKRFSTEQLSTDQHTNS